MSSENMFQCWFGEKVTIITLDALRKHLCLKSCSRHNLLNMDLFKWMSALVLGWKLLAFSLFRMMKMSSCVSEEGCARFYPPWQDTVAIMWWRELASGLWVGEKMGVVVVILYGYQYPVCATQSHDFSTTDHFHGDKHQMDWDLLNIAFFQY